jgi:nicotinamidase-related amidase
MLNSLEAVLVMVDFQGRLAGIVDRSELVTTNAIRLVKGCQALGVPILATAQVPEKLGPVLPELEESLENGSVIAKSSFSALREPDFQLALHKTGRKQVILTGIEAHVCVLQTGIDLLEAGYQVHVLSDGVFSRTAENHDLALKRLYEFGATLSSLEIALFEMVRTSKHPEFRTISRLIK